MSSADRQTHRSGMVFLLLATLSTCLNAADPTWQRRADQFLSIVNASYQSLYRVSSEAQWLASTDVTDAHDAASEIAGVMPVQWNQPAPAKISFQLKSAGFKLAKAESARS